MNIDTQSYPQKQNIMKNKLTIDNVIFEFDLGIRILKMKYDKRPSFLNSLELDWEKITTLSFKEICLLENIEHRRVCIYYLGQEEIVKEVAPKLIDTQTVSKTTTWIEKEGGEKVIKYEDTYSLYEVEEKKLLGETSNWSDTLHYVSLKDTSSDRMYMVWVKKPYLCEGETFDAVDAIAWTFQTKVKLGDITHIIRQGDCILVGRKEGTELGKTRHLTKDEYLTLLKLES